MNKELLKEIEKAISSVRQTDFLSNGIDKKELIKEIERIENNIDDVPVNFKQAILDGPLPIRVRFLRVLIFLPNVRLVNEYSPEIINECLQDNKESMKQLAYELIWHIGLLNSLPNNNGHSSFQVFGEDQKELIISLVQEREKQRKGGE